MSDQPQVTKRRVTMTTPVTRPDPSKPGEYITEVHTAVDYVREPYLTPYVADARTRWQSVEVSDEPDAGPGGYYGQTAVPDGLSHPDAGKVFPAETDPSAGVN